MYAISSCIYASPFSSSCPALNLAILFLLPSLPGFLFLPFISSVSELLPLLPVFLSSCLPLGLPNTGKAEQQGKKEEEEHEERRGRGIYTIRKGLGAHGTIDYAP